MRSGVGDLRTVRWTGNGQDRVYVVQSDGIQVGWVDLVTGERHVVTPALAREVDAALSAYAGVAPTPDADGQRDETRRSGRNHHADGGRAADLPRRARVGLWWRDGWH